MRCYSCGRFFSFKNGYAWQLVYSGWPQTPDEEIYRCNTCVGKYGEFYPQHGIKPEFSCGYREGDYNV